jgi:hypothetical protein
MRQQLVSGFFKPKHIPMMIKVAKHAFGEYVTTNHRTPQWYLDILPEGESRPGVGNDMVFDSILIQGHFTNLYTKAAGKSKDGVLVKPLARVPEYIMQVAINGDMDLDEIVVAESFLTAIRGWFVQHQWRILGSGIIVAGACYILFYIRRGYDLRRLWEAVMADPTSPPPPPVEAPTLSSPPTPVVQSEIVSSDKRKRHEGAIFDAVKSGAVKTSSAVRYILSDLVSGDAAKMIGSALFTTGVVAVTYSVYKLAVALVRGIRNSLSESAASPSEKHTIIDPPVLLPLEDHDFLVVDTPDGPVRAHPIELHPDESLVRFTYVDGVYRNLDLMLPIPDFYVRTYYFTEQQSQNSICLIVHPYTVGGDAHVLLMFNYVPNPTNNELARMWFQDADFYHEGKQIKGSIGQRMKQRTDANFQEKFKEVERMSDEDREALHKDVDNMVADCKLIRSILDDTGSSDAQRAELYNHLDQLEKYLDEYYAAVGRSSAMKANKVLSARKGGRKGHKRHDHGPKTEGAEFPKVPTVVKPVVHHEAKSVNTQVSLTSATIVSNYEIGLLAQGVFHRTGYARKITGKIGDKTHTFVLTKAHLVVDCTNAGHAPLGAFVRPVPVPGSVDSKLYAIDVTKTQFDYSRDNAFIATESMPIPGKAVPVWYLNNDDDRARILGVSNVTLYAGSTGSSPLVTDLNDPIAHPDIASMKELRYTVSTEDGDCGMLITDTKTGTAFGLHSGTNGPDISGTPNNWGHCIHVPINN